MKSDTQYFRGCVFVALILSIMALVSCQTTRAGTKIVSYPSERIVKHSKLLADTLQITDLRTGIANGLKRIQITAENLTDVDRAFEYRFRWLDAKQYEVKSPLSSWSTIHAIARDTINIHGIAPNKDVTDFELMVRFPKRW